MTYMDTELVNESRRTNIFILSSSVSWISASKVEHFSARSPQVPVGLVPWWRHGAVTQNAVPLGLAPLDTTTYRRNELYFVKTQSGHLRAGDIGNAIWGGAVCTYVTVIPRKVFDGTGIWPQDLWLSKRWWHVSALGNRWMKIEIKMFQLLIYCFLLWIWGEEHFENRARKVAF